jgi:Skp family chaperone for outer membrane proteins
MNGYIRGALAGGAVVVAVLAVMAFQAANTKIGMVNLGKVVQDSKIGKEAEEKFRQETDLRDQLLMHFDAYRYYDPEQREEIWKLWVKRNRTQEEETRLTVLKSTGQSLQKEVDALQQKQQRTAEEDQRYQQLVRRQGEMVNYLPYLKAALEGELEKFRADSLSEVYDKARTSVRKVAKAQGFSVIYTSQVAPYAEFDISEDVLNDLGK